MTVRSRRATTLVGTILAIASLGEARAQSRGQPGSAVDSVNRAHGIVEVPFRRVKDQRLVDVYVRGQGPFTFLLDTGVSGAGIDLALATRLGIDLPDRGAPGSSGRAGGPRIYQTWITDFALGSYRLDSLQAAALPLSAFGERLGEPLHGILGDGFLDERVTRFDDVRRTIAFADSPGAFEVDFLAADYIAPLTLSSAGGMPSLEVTLSGRSFMATLDMGSSLGLEVFFPFADELGLGHAREEWKRDSVLGGSLGRAEILDGTVERIDIGPLTFRDVPTSITAPRSERNRKGNLGNQLWAGYVVILDYVERRLVFRKP